MTICKDEMCFSLTLGKQGDERQLCDIKKTFPYSGDKPCPSSVWKSIPPWLSHMSAVQTEEMHGGRALTASCQTQTTTQHQATLHPHSPWRWDSPSMQMLAKGEKKGLRVKYEYLHYNTKQLGKSIYWW